ncbi:MAG: hypothetical protein LBT98_03785, partial [Puniceicoccales bacterium]|nr:hypothetical protein [Puniceicoccales bacterium]
RPATPVAPADSAKRRNTSLTITMEQNAKGASQFAGPSEGLAPHTYPEKIFLEKFIDNRRRVCQT